MLSAAQKLARLRGLFEDASALKGIAPIDAYVLPSTDAHQSEYLAERDFRVKFLSGFSGSNAFTLITKEKALLWTDGRYFLQAIQEMGEGWELMKQAQPDSISPEEWLIQNMSSGARVGFDPEIYTYDEASTLMSSLSRAGMEVVPVEGNLVDYFWDSRPQLPNKKLATLSSSETGASIEEKLKRIRETITKRKCSAIPLLSLDDVMWTLNIRGGDIAFNPLAYSLLFVTATEAHLFIDDVKLDDASRSHLSPVSIHPYDEAIAFIKKYADSVKGTNTTVFIPSSTNYAIGVLFKDKMYQGSSPAREMKSRKNDTELACIRSASIRDSAALVKYFHWLENHVTAGSPLTEEEAGKKIDGLRSQEEKYMDLSFPTICAVGAHAALPHYHPTEGSEKVACDTKSVYLCDSGAHYRDGTTDVTRTVWYGSQVPVEFRRHNTLVLIAHIDMALTVFPTGINGLRIDMAARSRLWKEGLDFAHGVGHGVGHFLNVHETPNITFRKHGTESAIHEGTVITIEPGLYITDKWGIRIENVYEVVRAVVPSTDVFLSFKPLTLVPIQKEIIDVSLLEDRHRAWLNEYHSVVHSTVARELGTRMEEGKEAVLEWLARACAPI